jgi:hypothetical protein
MRAAHEQAQSLPLLRLMQRRVKERRLIARFLVVASIRYAWSTLKNCVKILIGRKPYYNDHDLFFRQYVFQLIGVRPIHKITCPGLRGEGAGSQALMIMSAINFARSSGLTYLHTPFTLIQHAERPMHEWVTAWEELFNLGAGEVRCDVKRHQVVNYCYNFVDLELCFGWRGRSAELEDSFRASIPEFRRKYYLNRSPRRNEQLTVAVHIRRGDVSADRGAHLFTSTETILRTTNLVKSILDTHNLKYRIDVYSNGDSAELAEFCLYGAELFTNPEADAIWTMRELIEADVLIMAKGSFSYYAALISDGVIIFEPYGSPLDNWIVRAPDGSFDTAAFEHQLFPLIQAKGLASTTQSVLRERS